MTTNPPTTAASHESVLRIDATGTLFGLDSDRASDGWKTAMISRPSAADTGPPRSGMGER